jgi:glycine/D-amino acid oxidase-like deaminating enzyme
MNDRQDSFDHECDVLVVGYGFAGAAAAIAAADAGKAVLLIEKMPDPGGISLCSGGSARSAFDFDDALAYLRATNAGRTPDDVLAVLAQGMVDMPDYLGKLAAACGLKITPLADQQSQAGRQLSAAGMGDILSHPYRAHSRLGCRRGLSPGRRHVRRRAAFLRHAKECGDARDRCLAGIAGQGHHLP